MAAHYDGAGNRIVEGYGLYFSDSGLVSVQCAVTDCPNKAYMFGVLEFGGSIGAVCETHRHNQDAIDDLITAKFDKSKSGNRA